MLQQYLSRTATAVIFVALGSLLGGSARGGIEDRTYPSAVMNKAVGIKVYTPPGYTAGQQRYPVVYNLHGGGGSPDRQWDRTKSTLLDAIEMRQRIRPMIYVFANGLGDTLFVDTYDGAKKAETTVIKELIPFIDANYRSIPAREARAIDGFSMGGFGALHFAFKYPELFSSVVSYGAALLTYDTLSERDRRENFGGRREFFTEHNPWTWAARNAAKIREMVKVRMVIGAKDKLIARNDEFKKHLDANKIPVSYEVVPDVEHCTKCLYEKAGLQSLQFIAAAFATPGRGHLQDRTYSSASMKRVMRFKIYTPPGYETGEGRYPVVYNLHGAGGGSPDRQWNRIRKTLVDAMDNERVRPMIYVFVDGLGDTFFADSFDGTRKAETSFIKELIPHVDAQWRTIAAKRGRAIDGFSMGGCGALMQAFKHPALFSSVVSYGAALVGFDRLRGREMGKLIFNDDQVYFDEYNPRIWAKRNEREIRRSVRVRMVIGAEDNLYETNVDFKQMLDQLKIPYSWKVVGKVAHCTECLYGEAGLESLKFIADGFDT